MYCRRAIGTGNCHFYNKVVSSKNVFWLNKIRDNPVKAFREILGGAMDRSSAIFVSFDIDSIMSSSCPGVSAPATVGLTAQEACDLCFEAGLCLSVRLMDVSEFNPQVEDYRTGKLLALLFYHFVLGRVKALKQ